MTTTAPARPARLAYCWSCWHSHHTGGHCSRCNCPRVLGDAWAAKPPEPDRT